MKTINYSSPVLGLVSYEIPFKIKCNVSGVEKIYTSESYINKKIERFGGLDKLLKEYVCQDAKRLLKEGKEIEVISEELKANPHPKRTFKNKAEELPAPPEEVILEVVEDKPIMKQDRRGLWRDVKGRVIGKDNLDQYRMVAE